MLTAQGMRQKFLHGKWNRDKYMKQHNLLSEEFRPGELYI